MSHWVSAFVMPKVSQSCSGGCLMYRTILTFTGKCESKMPSPSRQIVSDHNKAKVNKVSCKLLCFDCICRCFALSALSLALPLWLFRLWQMPLDEAVHVETSCTNLIKPASCEQAQSNQQTPYPTQPYPATSHDVLDERLQRDHVFQQTSHNVWQMLLAEP